MSKKALVLLGIIGLIIIFLMCAFLHWRNIEKDVANCSTNILNNAKLSSLSVETQDRGRDVLVSGTVTNEEDKQRALTLLKDQCHMTDLDSKIKIVTPKPTIQPFLNLRNNGGNVTVSGSLASLTEVKNALASFGSNTTNKTTYNKEIIPAGFDKYISHLIPQLSNINDYDVDIKKGSISLKGYVASTEIKQNIGQQLTNALNGKVKVLNLLTVIAPKPVVLPQLDAKDCQQDLSDLLSQSKIQFNSGSAVIKQESTPLLTSLAATTKSCHGVTIMIIGHTDSSGNAQSNVILSQNRAQSVVNYLLKTGVQEEKLKSTGTGSSQPIASNETKEGRATNRRIEFKVQSL